MNFQCPQWGGENSNPLDREYGLPRIIRTANGAPFATTAIGRLSRLSVWWIRLGIFPELIEPAHPEQNARHERPHEALGQQTPASVHRPSDRMYPNRLPKLEYPGHFEVRRVSRSGGVRWNSKGVCVSHVLGEEYVGFEEVDNGLWEVCYGPVRLGRFHERISKIEDDRGRIYRKNVLPVSPDESVAYPSGRSARHPGRSERNENA